jgi:hypothetical protein
VTFWIELAAGIAEWFSDRFMVRSDKPAKRRRKPDSLEAEQRTRDPLFGRSKTGLKQND